MNAPVPVLVDPFLGPDATDPHGNPLDTVDPVWGLPAAERVAVLTQRGAA